MGKLDFELVGQHQICCDETRLRLAEKDIRGPWDHEPDQFEFESHGFPCIALRNHALFHWCGYVGVPKTFPVERIDDLDVHGGVTYNEVSDKDRIQMLPTDHTWIGFDCGHSFDLSPTMLAFYVLDLSPMLRHALLKAPGTYRELSYVKAQCEAIASQLSRLNGPL